MPGSSTNPPVSPLIWVSYLPQLLGATSNPTGGTYTKQLGEYAVQDRLCHFTIDIQVSGFTKTSLTDTIRASLPLPAATGTDRPTRIWGCRAEGATLLKAGSLGFINPGDSFISLASQGPMTDITYALLGLLTNQFILQASGVYRIG